mgnify:CR=1 FL=1
MVNVSLLEKQISNDKKMINENNNDEQAMLSFSDHTFTLLIKRIKHCFYTRGVSASPFSTAFET